MTRVAPFAALSLTTLAALIWATSVSAQARMEAPDPRCAALPIVIDGPLDALWLEAIGRVCEQLSRGNAVDQEATLRMHAFGDALVIEATLVDGRRAVRHVTTPLALGRVVEALLVLPSAASSSTAATSIETTDAGVPVASASTTEDPADALGPTIGATARESARAPTPPAPEEPGRLALHAGLGLMGRVTRGATLSLGVAAHGSISLGPGELGVIARWEPVMQEPTSAPPGFEAAAFGLGVVVGARTQLGARAELGAGVEVTVLDQLESVTTGMDEVSGSNTDVRVGAIVRLEVGVGHGLAPFISLDAEISPLVAGRTVRIDPALPAQAAWSAGTSVGLAWTGT